MGAQRTLLRRLLLPHLSSAPLRSGLVVLGIALGVATVVASSATSDSLQQMFSELVERIANRADLIIAGSGSGVPVARVADVAAVPGVEHAAAAVEVTTHFSADNEPLLVLGVDFLGDTFFLPFQTEGAGPAVVDDPLAFVNEPNAIVISASLAKRRKLRIGDEIELSAAGGSKRFVVRGLVADSGPAASFGGQVAVMFLDAAQIAFERGTLVDRIDVALAPGADRSAISGRLARLLGASARVQLPVEAGQRLRALSEPLADGMRLSGLLAMMVAVFIIYNAAGVSVAQRRREIGVLRALGVRRRDVIVHFCLESMVLALVGIALGLLLSQQLVTLAYAQTRVAMDQMFGTPPPPPRIALDHVLRGAAVGLFVSWFAALLPARRGARLDPVAALRPSSHIGFHRQKPVRLLALAGATSMALAAPIAAQATMTAGYAATLANLGGAGLMMPLAIVLLRRALLPLLVRTLGASGRLGLDHIERDLGRSTMTVLSLMAAVALSIGVSSWLYSFEQCVRGWFEQVSAADMVITAGSPISNRGHMPLGAGTIAKLEHIDGLETVQAMRLVDQRYGAETIDLVASDTRAYLFEANKRGKPWRVLDGRSPIGERELLDAPQIVLSENAARRLQLKAGDAMRFDTPSGPARFTVRAVVVDYSSQLGTAFIDRRYYQTPWQDAAVDQINLYLAAGADQAKVTRTIHERLGGGKALFVTDTGALREELMRNADRGFAYARSLELIMLLIAIMGVTGTLVAAVLDRTREIGIQRAIGATRRQIVQAMMIEAAFLGVCGVCGGLAAGSIHTALLLHTVVARSSGWLIPFAFPWTGALRVTSLVIGTAALAGLVPGMRAARLDAKTALASE